MAEEQHGSRGNFHGNRRSYNSGKPGSRGGKGFKPRSGNSGKSYGRKSGGFHKDGGFREGGDRRDGYRKGNGEFRRDSEGGERREYRGGDRKFQDRRFNGERRSGGFHRDGESRDFHGSRGDNPRYQRRDRDDSRKSGDSPFREGGDRSFHRDGFRKDGGERREYRGGDDRRSGGFRRDNRRDGQRDFRHGDRRDDRRDFRRDDRNGHDERREFTREEKAAYREEKRRDYLSKPHRNSDGTISYPSQNPYTDRRPNEPKMPRGIDLKMLSKDEKERLRGLSKEHADNIGYHILAAYTLEESDPKAALEHAKWVAHQASRIDFARETLAFVAYRQGDYKLAMREFRTAYRMNGFLDYLPFIADCERGVGNPKKAVEIAMSDEARQLRGEAKAEMLLVYAGALGDLKLWDKAIEIVHMLGRSKGLAGAYRMRAIQAEQYFLEEAGRADEATDLDVMLDRLELQYADADEDETSDDLVIEYDMHQLSEELMDELGITEEDAQYAPEDFDEDESDDEESEHEDSEDETSDDETELAAEEAEAGAQSDEEPAQTFDEGELTEHDPVEEQSEEEASSSEESAE